MWTIEPDQNWINRNLQWMPETQVSPKLCDATFQGRKCELVADHSISHMIRKADAEPEPTKSKKAVDKPRK